MKVFDQEYMDTLHMCIVSTGRDVEADMSEVCARYSYTRVRN